MDKVSNDELYSTYVTTVVLPKIFGLKKFNPNHDELGRFSEAGDEAGGEHGPDHEPRVGEKFTVFRLGRGEDLTDRNAGNAESVANHLARIQDFESPANIAGSGDTVTAYEVTPHEKFGTYTQFIGGSATGTQSSSSIGRSTMGARVAYSFPKGSGFSAKKIGAVSLSDLHSALAQRGFSDFDDSGYNVGAQVIRAAFKPVEKFDPDQPRDDAGRWTDSDGGGGHKVNQAIETAFATKLGMTRTGFNASGESEFKITNRASYEAAVSEYQRYAEKELPGFGDRLINTDVARELSPDYRADRSRSADVHEPASLFAKQLYADYLARPTPGGRDPLVFFTAGGTGAGKSSGLELPKINAMVQGAGIIYDTNMNSYGSAEKKIDQALASGRQVAVMYVHRDPVEALSLGALPRASRQESREGSGRTVPLSEHMATHIGALPTVLKLQEHYASRQADTLFFGVDNTRGRGNATVADLGALHQWNQSEIEGKLNAALETARERKDISDSIYAGFKGKNPRAAGEAGSEGVGKSTGADLGRRTQPGLPKEVRLLGLLKFRDDQTRDDHGRWTDEGGGMRSMFERISKPDGGFTYSPSLKSEPNGGYALSIHPERSAAFDADKIKFADLALYAARNTDLLSKPKNYIGAWHDPESHKIFLDVSTVIGSRSEAEHLALKHDQIAIYGLAEGKSFTVNKHATSGGVVGKGVGDGQQTRTALSAVLKLQDRPADAGRAMGKAHRQEADAAGDGGSHRGGEGAQRADLKKEWSAPSSATSGIQPYGTGKKRNRRRPRDKNGKAVNLRYLARDA